MCENCFNDEIYKFKTYSEFVHFEKELILKYRYFTISNSKEKNLYKYHTDYQCNSCFEIWYLSEPDNAWLGYFLRENSAKSYIDEIKKLDKKKKYGCLLTLSISFLIIIYCLLK